MEARTKYTISVKSNSPEILERVFNQVEQSFGVDNRKSVVCSGGLEFNEEEGFFEMKVTEDSDFKPVVMYGFDQDLRQFSPEGGLLTEVTITCHRMNNSEMYKKIGEATHMQFCGLQAYVDSDIVINTDFNQQTYVAFCECNYYPIIAMVFDK